METRAHPASPHRRDPEPATKRVLEALSHGLTPSETATVLGIATGTVTEQCRRARNVLAAKTTTHAVANSNPPRPNQLNKRGAESLDRG